MVLWWKMLECSLWIGEARSFLASSKHVPSILGSYSWMMEMWSVSWTDRLVQRQQLCGHCIELSWWAECWAKRWSFRFTNQSTSQSKIWVMTKRVRSWIQLSKISFPFRVARLRHRDWVRSSDIQEDLRVEPLLLHVKWSQMRLFG